MIASINRYEEVGEDGCAYEAGFFGEKRLRVKQGLQSRQFLVSDARNHRNCGEYFPSESCNGRGVVTRIATDPMKGTVAPSIQTEPLRWVFVHLDRDEERRTFAF